MAKATVTVQMDAQGRVVIPKPARDKLNLDGDSATVEIEVRHDE